MHLSDSEVRARHYERNAVQVRAKIKLRRITIRDAVQALKVGKACAKCGENHPACLDFHHRDASQKEVNISMLGRRGWCWERILREVAKCDLVCSNCHRKTHFSVSRKAAFVTSELIAAATNKTTRYSSDKGLTFVDLQCPGCGVVFSRLKRTTFLQQKTKRWTACSRRCMGLFSHNPIQGTFTQKVLSEYRVFRDSSREPEKESAGGSLD